MFQLVDTTYGQKIAHLYIIKPGMYITKKLTSKFPHNAKKKKIWRKFILLLKVYIFMSFNQIGACMV